MNSCYYLFIKFILIIVSKSKIFYIILRIFISYNRYLYYFIIVIIIYLFEEKIKIWNVKLFLLLGILVEFFFYFVNFCGFILVWFR